ncbi:MAG: tetratricopeptide repeat protein [Bacteroidales bacterium]|nr:tetratricopeptide repeat protein [Bacteroidales bacterium]
MKRNILFIALMAILVTVGCNRTVKTTQDDVKKAEAALFNEDMTANAEAVPYAIATFGKYVEDNPEATDAPDVLFKAVEVSINTRQDPQQSIGLVNKLVADYPKFDKNPVALFMLATFVYDEQQHDLDKAREAYQQVIDNYPESPFAKDAEISITQLGMTPEELIRMFEAQVEN